MSGHRHKDSRAKWTTTDDAEPHPADILTAAQVSKLILLAEGGNGTTPIPNPPPTPPPDIAPAGIAVSGVTTTGATVSWTTTDASTGLVQYGTTTAYGSSTSSTSSGTTGSRTLSSLTPGQLYHFRVVTTSGSTTIQSSDRTFSTTAAPTLPGTPTNLVATGGNTQIVLTWAAPSSNGGSAITGYHLYRNGASLLTLGVVTTYTNTGLTNGIQYTYTVAAITAIGEGPQSNSASATPAASGDINPPIISAVTVTVTGQTTATVTCTTNEAATVIVEYGTSTAYGTQTSATASGTSHSRNLTGLASGTLYHFRIRATDTAGNLAIGSPDRTFQTQTPPPPPTGGYPPDTTLGSQSIQNDARPAYLASIIDSTFGTRITRISSGAGQRHAYSKSQPWNSDQTRMSQWTLGSKPMLMLNGSSYALVRNVDAANEFRWSNTDPTKMYGFNGGTNQFVSLNVNTDARTVLHTFTGISTIDIGAGEGNLSDDDKYVLLHGHGPETLILYRIDTDTVIATKTFTTLPDNSTVSPTGTYCVLNWEANTVGGQSGVEVWTPSGGTLVYQRRLAGTGVHGDVGYDQSGNEVWVQMSHYSGGGFSGEQWGVVPMYRLDTGARTNLFSVSTAYGAGHVSCRNVDRHGWAYLSTYTRSPGYPGSDQVVAVKMDGSGTVEVFGFEHHNRYPDYFYEPQAVPSRDGKRVVWASEWYPNTDPLYDFVGEAS